MNRFKKGITVKCINADGLDQFLTVGNDYELTKDICGRDLFLVHNLSYVSSFDFTRFIPINNKIKQKTMSKKVNIEKLAGNIKEDTCSMDKVEITLKSSETKKMCDDVIVPKEYGNNDIPQGILESCPSDEYKIKCLKCDIENLEKTAHNQMLAIDKKDEELMDAGLIIKEKDKIISDLQSQLEVNEKQTSKDKLLIREQRNVIDSLKYDAKIDEVKEIGPGQDEVPVLKETIAKQAEVLREKDEQINQLNKMRARLMTTLGVIKSTIDLA